MSHFPIPARLCQLQQPALNLPPPPPTRHRKILPCPPLQLPLRLVRLVERGAGLRRRPVRRGKGKPGRASLSTGCLQTLKTTICREQSKERALYPSVHIGASNEGRICSCRSQEGWEAISYLRAVALTTVGYRKKDEVGTGCSFPLPPSPLAGLQVASYSCSPSLLP